VPVRVPTVPYISAVDAARHADPQDIRRTLVQQLASPVRWTSTVQALIAGGARVLVECGPGKVLTALNRRIERGAEVQCLALEDAAGIDAAMAAGSGHDHGEVHAGN
jgi:[acyl-carrier-protein] S-malonyltransferase